MNECVCVESTFESGSGFRRLTDEMSGNDGFKAV